MINVNIYIWNIFFFVNIFDFLLYLNGIYCIVVGTFIVFGLSGVVSVMYYVIIEGFYNVVNFAVLGWFCLMVFLYIVGVLIYVFRILERIFLGKFDIWVRLLMVCYGKCSIVNLLCCYYNEKEYINRF